MVPLQSYPDPGLKISRINLLTYDKKTIKPGEYVVCIFTDRKTHHIRFIEGVYLYSMIRPEDQVATYVAIQTKVVIKNETANPGKYRLVDSIQYVSRKDILNNVISIRPCKYYFGSETHIQELIDRIE